MMHKIGPMRAAAALSPERPRDASGREMISIRGLLEWAFAVECASLDHDEVGQIGPDGFSYRSATAGICDMLALGDPGGEPGRGVKVDVFGGRSYPHDDAELVATTVRAVLTWGDAVTMAEHARTCSAPVWDLPPTACKPVEWKGARFDVAKTISPPRKGVRIGGRLVRYVPTFCPVHYSPTAMQIGAARRAYLAWVTNLLHLRGAMQSIEFQRFVVIEPLPKRMPWKNTC